MRLATVLAAALALGAAHAQVKAPPVAAKPAGTVTPADKSVPLESIRALEKEMDLRIAATGTDNDRCVVLGPTRGFYLNGLGAVFTAEVGLAVFPGAAALVGAPVGAEQRARIRKSKLAHVPMIEQTLRDIVLSLVASPALKLSENEQVVVAVRFYDQASEDRTGLPAQMVARLEHRGAAITVEKQ
jgi:hypothetical protein